jgi:hypothetical protein
MRTLHVVPIIHTAEDLGSLAPAIELAKVKAGLSGSSSVSRRTVRDFWVTLQDAIEAWPLDASTLSVYQDALPVSHERLAGVEHQIIDELAAKGSRNHQILQWLRSRGARVLGTESPELLIEEYHLMKAAIERSLEDDHAPDAEADEQTRRLHAEMLLKRDQFIARRIDQTLDVGACGMIFIGLLHRIEPHLPGDINVNYPFGRPTRV